MAKSFNATDYPMGMYVGNQWKQCRGPSLRLKNPKDESTIPAQLRAADSDDVDEAVQQAHEAFTSGPWSQYTGVKRGQCLNRLADLIEAHTEDLSMLESIASGVPIGSIQQSLPLVADILRYYAGWADKIKGDSFPAEAGFFRVVSHEPLGVCAGITAWNGSFHFLAWKAGPALAAGNTIILKPSEKSPLGTLAVGYLIERAGFPPGVFQILPGDGSTGALLAKHMNISKISFTGSIATGRKIQQAATNSNLKRVTLELGGKSPAIVFDDAAIDEAVLWSTIAITANTGQVCAASSRLYLHESIMDEFLEKLQKSFSEVASGLGVDPQDVNSTYGPLVDKAQYDKVSTYIQEGSTGSSIVKTGPDYSGRGFFMPPVLLINPEMDAPAYKEEIFGPVLCVRSFKTEEEALRLANDTTYGLAGSVYTKDVGRAIRVSSKMQAGSVCVNCAIMVGPQTPTGGFKMSGIGRELGEYALRHYTEPKSIWIKV